MTLQHLLIFLIIGGVAGWLASMVVRGGGMGLIGDVLTGVIGAFIGGWIFAQFRIAHGTGFTGALIGATVGAIVLLLVLRLVRRTA